MRGERRLGRNTRSWKTALFVVLLLAVWMIALFGIGVVIGKAMLPDPPPTPAPRPTVMANGGS